MSYPETEQTEHKVRNRDPDNANSNDRCHLLQQKSNTHKHELTSELTIKHACIKYIYVRLYNFNNKSPMSSHTQLAGDAKLSSEV